MADAVHGVQGDFSLIVVKIMSNQAATGMHVGCLAARGNTGRLCVALWKKWHFMGGGSHLVIAALI